jgi:class 3 adenylate cyclase/tetratricopeptide (TPR) repeat protein
VDRVQTGFYDSGMPVCGRCGEDNPERARFCLACAAPLAAPPVARREERKRVSVLFCDLVGFTARSERLDIEDVRGLLTPYYARLRADLERFGGTVEKFIGDAVMALFGAPVAHEDDPERAVRSALAIREAIAQFNEQDPGLGLHVRVGVTTGEALVALDARPAEGEGMASGDVVNTAARLQAAAPVDGILVDEATWRATDRQINYQAVEPVQAKGKADPVMVWQTLEARASLGLDVAQAPTTPLVARERELQLLWAALERARSEQTAQLVTLVGVPGMGKSRLVFELLQAVEADPELVTWRQGRCLPYGEGVALWALGEIVKAQAGILDSDPAEQAAAKLTRTVHALLTDEAEAAWVLGQLGPLVGLGGDTEAGGGRQAEAFAAWRRFVEAVAEQGPAVLVVEDLHWADETLLDFLDHLVDWAAEVPLLVVGTARPELLSRRPGWGGGKPNAANLSLAPLSEADTARLVGGLLGQALLPAELQATLLARSGGNPLYAEEYVRMLADRGFLKKIKGSWRLERTADLPVPESVQHVIAARLDTLSLEEKALLQDAAVLGKVGWLGALTALAGLPRWTVEQRLHGLERRELLRRERRSQVAGERQYAFRHVLVRDVAYGQLPRAARADRHQRAAQWIEALSPDRAEDWAELLAHHYQAALEYAQAAGQDTALVVERARLALREAGDRALELNAFAAAARWYAAALELWPPTDPERPRLLFRLGRVRFYAEETGEDLLVEARDGLLALGDREAAAEAEGLLGGIALMRGQGQQALEHDRQAVALLEDRGPSRAKAYVLANLAFSLIQRGQYQEAIGVGRQAIAMADGLGLDELRAKGLNYVGMARVAAGDPGGVADLEHALAIAVRTNSPNTALGYGNLVHMLFGLGELARAFEPLDKGRQAAERLGRPGDLRAMQTRQAMGDYWQGHWDAAKDAADQLIAEAQAGPHYAEDASCRLIRAWIRLARGDLPGALDDTDTAVQLAQAADVLDDRYWALSVRGRILLAAGHTQEADAQASELLALLLKGGAPLTAPDWSGDLAVVLQALGRASDLQELTRVWTATPWRQAVAAIATGNFEHAADLYAEIGSLPDEAFARLQAAKQLFAAGQRAEADTQLQRALGFFRQVKASAYLREGEALLAASA